MYLLIFQRSLHLTALRYYNKSTNFFPVQNLSKVRQYSINIRRIIIGKLKSINIKLSDQMRVHNSSEAGFREVLFL